MVENSRLDMEKPLQEEGRNLLTAFMAGNEEAFSSIYSLYIHDLFAYGMGLGFEREELKDAIQEVFYRFYQNRKQLGHVREIKYYLLRMLKNYLYNLYRNRMEINKQPLTDLSFSIKTTILDEIIAEEDRLIVEDKIDQLLNLLTDRQREAVYLRFIQELEYEEIGRLLQMTPEATRKLVYRAIKRMRENQMNILFILSCFGCM